MDSKFRAKLEREIFNNTGKDFRGGTLRDGDRSILMYDKKNGGTCLVYLSGMTDEELTEAHKERIKPEQFFCSSFCNFSHSMKNGKPVGHECYILNPAALKAEADGNTELVTSGVIELFFRGKRVVHKGKRGQ